MHGTGSDAGTDLRVLPRWWPGAIQMLRVTSAWASSESAYSARGLHRWRSEVPSA